MATGTAIAKDEEVKRSIGVLISLVLLKNHPRLIDATTLKFSVIPAHASSHLTDFALDRGITGEIQDFSGIGATTCNATCGLTVTVTVCVSRISPSITSFCTSFSSS